MITVALWILFAIVVTALSCVTSRRVRREVRDRKWADESVAFFRSIKPPH